MRIIDLTHPIAENMPVYPGTEPPVFVTGCSIEDNGFLEKKITLYSHTGTHIDAPAHLLTGYQTLDQMPVDQFYGKVLIIHSESNHKQTIEIYGLEPYEERIKGVDFVLIHTGWSQYWGTDRYFSRYPVLSLEAANWLADYKLKGLGMDTISADRADTQNYPVHKAFLRNNMIVIENLTNLEDLSCDQVLFSCFPLHLTQADGSPVRAIAMVE